MNMLITYLVKIIIQELKMLDRTVNLDGLFSYILYTDVAVDDDGNVKIGYMRYEGCIDIDNNIIYRRR